jgi:hypothetical protein
MSEMNIPARSIDQQNLLMTKLPSIARDRLDCVPDKFSLPMRQENVVLRHPELRPERLHAQYLTDYE